MDTCPMCGMNKIGRIGRNRFFCAECCHEWTAGTVDVMIYKIMADGTTIEFIKDSEFEFPADDMGNDCCDRRVG